MGAASLTFNGATGLTVQIRDATAIRCKRSASICPPSRSTRRPSTANAITPMARRRDVHTRLGDERDLRVTPSYYMKLRNRLLATQRSRAAHDPGRRYQPQRRGRTDLRVIAGWPTCPPRLFKPHRRLLASRSTRRADRTRTIFASPTARAPASAPRSTEHACVKLGVPTTGTTTTDDDRATDWRNGADGSPITSWFTSAALQRADRQQRIVRCMPTQHVHRRLGHRPRLRARRRADQPARCRHDARTRAPPTFRSTGGQLGAATQRTPNALVPSPVIFGSLPAGINPATPAHSAAVAHASLLSLSGGDTGTPTVIPASRLAARPSHPRQFLDAGGRALRHQHLHGHGGQDQPQRPDRAVHLSPSQHRAARAARRSAHSGDSRRRWRAPTNRRARRSTSIWNTVDEDATIAQIENRFANGSADAYLSESEICTVPLVPQGRASPASPRRRPRSRRSGTARAAARADSPATTCANCPTRSSTAG